MQHMSKEEKKNVLIAIALSIAAVVIIWLLTRGNVAQGTTAGDTINVPAGDNTPTAYNNYNLAPFNSPTIPGVGDTNITSNTGTGTNTGGCGCETQCGPPGGQQVVDIPFYQQFLGIGP